MILKIDEGRFPPVTPALLLETTSMEVRRDIVGMNFCRDREVGPMRRKLGPLTEIGPVEGLDKPFDVARDRARVVLAAFCAACPFDTCKMKGWGLTVPPSAAKRVGGGAGASAG
jgi:hypothetical protein